LGHSSIAINPHATQTTSPLALCKSLWCNRQLIVQMTKREVVDRYKGSAMGLAWSFFNPVFMLVVYTFVFSEIFKSRWGGVGGDDSKTQFTVVLFVGMIVLGLFSEVVNRVATNLRFGMSIKTTTGLLLGGAFSAASLIEAIFFVETGKKSRLNLHLIAILILISILLTQVFMPTKHGRNCFRQKDRCHRISCFAHKIKYRNRSYSLRFLSSGEFF
jgi:ABC-type polysaccharide/polyol phosphate export permease